MAGNNRERLKRIAAAYAVSLVEDGMVLGLGSGSTMAYFIDILAERLRGGRLRRIQAVPTSESTAARARARGIPLTSLDEHEHLDLVVDGADEVDP
ncbi:MAG: ribose 5-phosphate isomerase A, partial [Caldilineae bacterium]